MPHGSRAMLQGPKADRYQMNEYRKVFKRNETGRFCDRCNYKTCLDALNLNQRIMYVVIALLLNYN